MRTALALDLRRAAQVQPVEIEKVEGVEDKSVLIARRELGLEFGKVRPAVLDYHHLAVDDCLTRQVEGAGDHGEPFGPVQAAARVDLALALVEVDLDPIRHVESCRAY